MATTPVQLYRYDLTGGLARSMSMALIGRQLEGIWHTSIVAFGHEFYFDGGVGIMRESSPGHTRFGSPYRTELLGNTHKTEAEFLAWVQLRQRDGFGPNDYVLLENNCNHFSQAASQFLLGTDIPADIRDMIPSLLATPFGQMIRPTLEQATSSTAGYAPSPSRAVQPPASTAVAGLHSSRSALSEDERDDLILARTMLESNDLLDEGRSDAGVQTTLAALETLRAILQKVIDNPAEAKYRSVSTASKTYIEKLKPLEDYGIAELLQLAGFKLASPPAAPADPARWVLSDADGSRGVLEEIVSAVDDLTADVETAAAVHQSAAEATHSSTNEESAAREDHSERAASDGSPPVGASPRSTDESILRYCTPPFPEGFVPLRVGEEGGAPLFSLLVLSASSCLASLMPWSAARRDAENCFGKCRLSGDRRHVEAYYCSREGKEVPISSGYAVLCVRRQPASGDTPPATDDSETAERLLLWAPASMLTTSADSVDPATFVYHPEPGSRFGVARAPLGSGVHPGVREPSGRCVVPYGGRAEVVTAAAEVLCVRARVPPALAAAVDALESGDSLRAALEARDGTPFGSFTALLAWSGEQQQQKQRGTRQSSLLAAPVAPLRRRDYHAQDSSSPSTPDKNARANPLLPPPSRPKLLVCHDMRGGYQPGDRDVVFVAPASSPTPLDGAYTIGYWGLTDVFVYFSHHRVTVPPRAWVEAAHRQGVPALGTLITEGSSGVEDLRRILTDATVMGRVIARLAELCEYFGFDGYLVNIENSVSETLAKRLKVFVQALRERVAGLVIWYDAVTESGQLRYQNGLTAKNKSFFDVSDGIFTNYFWNPVHLALSKAAAAGRLTDVYVGVDVFGRNMFGGGQFNTHAATHEIARNGLSVALFAPAWTMESTPNVRDEYLRAECKLWSRLQCDFARRSMAWHLLPPGGSASLPAPTPSAACATAAVWSSFATGAAARFFVNGVEVGAHADAVTSGYCQIGTAHILPPVQYEPQEEAADSRTTRPASGNSSGNNHRGPDSRTTSWRVRLPLVTDGGRAQGGTAMAHWRTDCAWFGDQCLSVVVPPSDAVLIADWSVTGLQALEEAGQDVVVDLALLLPVKTARDGAEQASASMEGDAAVTVPVSLRARVQREVEATAAPTTVLLCEGQHAVSVYASPTVTPTPHSTPFALAAANVAVDDRQVLLSRWHVVRYNLSAAARAGDGGGRLAALCSLSAANPNARASTTVVLGGVAVHAVPSRSADSLHNKHEEEQEVGATAPRASASPLFAARVATPWPRFTVHPTRRPGEYIVQLQDVAKALASATDGMTADGHTVDAPRAGGELAFAVVATMGSDQTKSELAPPVTPSRVFLGVHRIAPDASDLYIRLSQPTSTVSSLPPLTSLEYFAVASGW